MFWKNRNQHYDNSADPCLYEMVGFKQNEIYRKVTLLKYKPPRGSDLVVKQNVTFFVTEGWRIHRFQLT